MLKLRYPLKIGNCRLSSCAFKAPKDLSNFPDKYDCHEVESKWYDWWDRNGCFKSSQRDSGKKFSMILPPPNVTGHLHMGHALTVAIQDSQTRWYRMKGFETVWIPGSDHAGIATQAVVEKWLKATENLARDAMGRTAFLEKVWEWKEAKGNRIFEQLKRLGASLDWSQATFTMSKEHTEAVNEAFRICLAQNLIYRGSYLVHWSPALGSALSDIEVDHVEIPPGKTYLELPTGKALVGQMYDIEYKVVGSDSESVIVSTTRPETIIGDVAVAVHPEDSRYTDLINRGVYLKTPLREDPIPLVCDRLAVDPTKGTGALKITPSHDPKDFEVGIRLSLPSLTIIDERGFMTFPQNDHSKLTSEGKDIVGLPRFVARTKILKYLKECGLLVQSRDHGMSVPVCSRTGDIVEPLPKPQWFLKMDEASKDALQVSQSGELQFHPDSYKNVWHNWLSSNRDWCISRQLWWGHRIPMWKVEGGVTAHLDPKKCQRNAVVTDDNGQLWVFGRTEEEARLNIGSEGLNLARDEDVLDTWFSSAVLPLASLGWPQKTESLAKFYPLSLMETGHDILFFWVARMVMMGRILTDSLPFKDVMLHAMISDPSGRKMSKSLGNVVDPLHIIEGVSSKALENELSESKANGSLSAKEHQRALSGLKRDFPEGMRACGADALRFGLCYNNVSTAQIKLDLQIIKTSAAFCNKIWQAARFLLMAHERRRPHMRFDTAIDPAKLGDLSMSNQWILSQCASAVANANAHYMNRDYHLLTRGLRQFLYTCLCDVYIEAAKPALNRPEDEVEFEATLQTLFIGMTTGLKLLHPLMPFITEELHHRVHHAFDIPCSPIIIENFPSEEDWCAFVNTKVDQDVEKCLVAINAIRTAKQMFGLKRSDVPPIKYQIVDEEGLSECLVKNGRFIESLVPCRSEAGSNLDSPNSWWVQKMPFDYAANVCVDLTGFITDPDRDLAKAKEKLAKLSSSFSKLSDKSEEHTAAAEALQRQIAFLQQLSTKVK